MCVACLLFSALSGLAVALAHSSPRNLQISALVKLSTTEIIKAHPCFQELLNHSVKVKVTGRDPSKRSKLWKHSVLLYECVRSCLPLQMFFAVGILMSK